MFVLRYSVWVVCGNAVEGFVCVLVPQSLVWCRIFQSASRAGCGGRTVWFTKFWEQPRGSVSSCGRIEKRTIALEDGQVLGFAFSEGIKPN